MRLRFLAPIAPTALTLVLAACGTEVVGEPAGADVVLIELSAEVPACGEPQAKHYADGSEADDDGPGTVAATDVDGDTATLLVDDEQEVDVKEGDGVDVRDGRLVVVAIEDWDEDTVRLRFEPGTGPSALVAPAPAATAGCPPPS